MKIRHLDHINMTVKNFNETANWYKRVFGFEVVEKVENDPKRGTWGVLKSGESMLCIYESPARKARDQYDLSKLGLLGISHFSFRITDRKEWEKVIRSEQIEIHYGGAYRYQKSHSWYLDDPNGYEIEVVLWDDDKINFSAEVLR